MKEAQKKFISRYREHDLNARDDYGWTPVMYAAHYNMPEIIEEMLRDKLSNVDDVTKIGKTALMIAAARDNVEALDKLIDCGASIDMQDYAGATALFYAVRSNSARCVKRLVDKHCNVEITDDIGTTAIFSAARLRNKECLQIMVDAGANVAIKDNYGFGVIDHVNTLDNGLNHLGSYDEIRKILGCSSTD